jgi:hypothetical protein
MGFGTRNGGPHKLLLVQRADNAAWPATRRPFIAAPRDLVVTGETTQSYRQPNPGSLWMYSHSGSTARNFVRIRRKATKSRTSSRGLQSSSGNGRSTVSGSFPFIILRRHLIVLFIDR